MPLTVPSWSCRYESRYEAFHSVYVWNNNPCYPAYANSTNILLDGSTFENCVSLTSGLQNSLFAVFGRMIGGMAEGAFCYKTH